MAEAEEKNLTGSGKGDEMNTELKEAIEALEKEKNIMRETLFEAIENALLTACKSNFGKADNIRVSVDRDTFEYSCIAEKKVVETEDDVEDKLLEIPLSEAVKINPSAEAGDTVDVKINSQSFGRIATQIAKNVILQKIREEERKSLYNQYYEKANEVLTGIVQRYVGNNVSVNLGKVDAMLNEKEMIRTRKKTLPDMMWSVWKVFIPHRELRYMYWKSGKRPADRGSCFPERIRIW